MQSLEYKRIKSMKSRQLVPQSKIQPEKLCRKLNLRFVENPQVHHEAYIS